MRGTSRHQSPALWVVRDICHAHDNYHQGNVCIKSILLVFVSRQVDEDWRCVSNKLLWINWLGQLSSIKSVVVALGSTVSTAGIELKTACNNVNLSYKCIWSTLWEFVGNVLLTITTSCENAQNCQENLIKSLSSCQKVFEQWVFWMSCPVQQKIGSGNSNHHIGYSGTTGRIVFLCYSEVQYRSLCLPLFTHARRKHEPKLHKPRDAVKVSQAEKWNRHNVRWLGQPVIISHKYIFYDTFPGMSRPNGWNFFSPIKT